MPRGKVDDYLKMKVMSATPMGLTLMVYERAIKDLRDAKKEIATRDRDKFSNYLIHSQDCIRELRSSLKLDVGQVAKNLYSIYSFMIETLVQANISRENPLVKINRVENMLLELLDTWRKAEKIEQRKKATVDINREPISINC